MRRRNVTMPQVQDMVEDLRRDIQGINATLEAGSGAISTDLQCIGPWPVSVRTDKGKAFPTLKCAVPAGTKGLKVVFERYTVAVADPDPELTVLQRIDDTEKALPDSITASGGVFTFEYDIGLRFNSLYGCPKLVAKMSDGSILTNPDTEPDPSPRLLSHYLPDGLMTIGPAFGSPSAPHVGNIIKNEFLPATKAFDAAIEIQVIAPASATLIATGSVAITNNSTTVNGTGTTFLSQAAVGKAITVNGETHIITAVPSNIQLTVDHPFKQTLSGQSAALLTLMTWEEAKTARIISKFRLTDDLDARPITEPHEITEDELALTSVIFRVTKFVAAQKYNWMRNVLVDDGGERVSITPLFTQTFTAGGFTEATAGLPELSGVAYEYDTTEPFNGKLREVNLKATQPNPPIALDRAELRRFTRLTGTVSVATGDATINGVGTLFLTELASGHQIIVGSQTFTINVIASDVLMSATVNSSANASGQTFYGSKRVIDEKNLRRRKFHPETGGQFIIHWGEKKTKKLLAHIFRSTLFAQNGNSRNIDDNFTTANTDEGATVPGPLLFPVAPTGGDNAPDDDPDTNLAKITIPVSTVAGAFADNNITGVEVIMRFLNEAGVEDLTQKLSPRIGISSTDSALSSIGVTFYAPNGKRIRIKRVIAHNGDKNTETVGTVDFRAGGLTTGAAVAGIPTPTVSIVNVNNKKDRVTVTVPQPNDGRILYYKNVTLDQDEGGPLFIEVKRMKLKDIASLHASTAATFAKEWTVRRSAGASVGYRARTELIGGSLSAYGSATNGATTGDMGFDTAAPTLAGAPTVEEQDGTLMVTCPTPTANINTLDQFQVIMSTQNTAPVGDPAIGVSGVVKIKYGQTVPFKPKRPQDVTLFFYYRARNLANGVPTYSVWSAFVSITPAGITRPLEDMIGTGVPIASERLEFTSATSPSGHTLSNFVLPASASAVDNFYVGMALYIPSLAVASQVRMITAYNAATKTVTVSPTFNSTPVGSLAHHIYRIGIPGDIAGRSGTGHTTTAFVLPTDASAVDNFYRGYSLYVPAATAANRIRKVLSYVGATRTLTLETAVSAAPATNTGFVLVNGSIGNLNPDQSGIYAPVPFRWFLEGGTNRLIFEVLPPIGDFSLQKFQVNVRRQNAAAALKGDSGAIPITSGLGWTFSAPTAYDPAAAIRFNNLFRGGGSDGWSAYSFWVPLSRAVGSGGAANYDPEIFGPAVILDHQGVGSYPIRYPVY